MNSSFRRIAVAVAVVTTTAGGVVAPVDARVDTAAPVVAVPGLSSFQESHIAYNPDRDEYLIVYETTGPLDIEAIRVAADGTPVGGPIAIAANSLSGELTADEASVVYNPVSKQYLVWFARRGLNSPPGAGRSSVIRGVRLSDVGVVVGGEVDLHPREGNFNFCDAADADVAVHPDGRYLLVNLRRYATTSAGGSCSGLTASQGQVLLRTLTSALSIGPAVVVSAPATISNLELPRVSAAKSGQVMVTWRASELAVGAARYSSTLAPDGTPSMLNYATAQPGMQIRNPRPLFDSTSGHWIIFATTPFGAASTHVVSTDGKLVRDGVITDAFRLRDVADLGNGTFALVNTSNSVWHLDGATGRTLEKFSALRAPINVVASVAATGDPANPKAMLVGLHPTSGDLATAVVAMYPPGSLPLVPGRVLDTRRGPSFTTVDGAAQGEGRRLAGSTLELQIAGRAGVPVGASAAQMNIAAAGATETGFVTAFPCDAARPTTSNLNFAGGAASSAAAFSRLSATGTVCLFVSTGIELIVDVNGYVPGTASVESLVPARLFESRPGIADGTIDGTFNGDGRVAAGSTTELVVTSRGGVPAAADAVIVNVTAVRPSTQAFVTVFPCGTELPTAASLNAAAGSFVNNLVLAKVGDGGKICLFSSAETHLIVDVTAYVPVGGGLISLSPGRLFESRAGQRTIDGMQQDGVRIAAGSTTKVVVAGRAGVPDGAVGAMLNVAAIKPSANGFLTVYPCGATPPNAANVNWAAGGIVSNAVFVKLDAAGDVCVFSTAVADLTVDIVGYTVDT